MPGRSLCERHLSANPSRTKPKPAPTVDAARTLLASERKAKRKAGMDMLCALHAEQLIIEYALKESDASILEAASQALDRHPPELIRHLLTQRSAYDANLYLRFHIARGNHLYAESVVHAVYAKRRRLTLDAINAIGMAYLRSLAGPLRKYLTAPLELYEDALESKGRKAVAGVETTTGWSRSGWAAVRAAVALTRLDADFDVCHVQRLLDEAERIEARLPHRDFWERGARERIGRTILGTRARLECVLFDRRNRTTPEKCVRLVREGAIEILPDLATTILKQNDEKLLADLIRSFPLCFFIESEFCFWPLLDWLEANAFLAKNEFGLSAAGSRGSLCQYWSARESRTAPPPWWQWR